MNENNNESIQVIESGNEVNSEFEKADSIDEELSNNSVRFSESDLINSDSSEESEEEENRLQLLFR